MAKKVMKNLFTKYSIVLWIFIIGSFVGFVWENIWTVIKGAYHLRQGLIYEPLIPIYGIGALVYYIVYTKVDIKTNSKIKNILLAFLLGFFVGGVTEYICSFFQEKIFGTISWNYSNLRFNLNGRTSLKHCLFWGLLGLLFFLIFIPLIEKLKKLQETKITKILTVIASCILLFDCTISILACQRQKERREDIEPTNVLEVFLDHYYTDDYLNLIFNNARQPKRD